MVDEQELVAAWLGGERAAGAALIERYYDVVTRFFANKAGPSAEDLTQRTFLLCAGAVDRFRAEGSFRAFLLGIARNVLYEHIRSRARDARIEPDFSASSLVDLAPGVATLVDARADKRVLGLALQSVPLELQILLELYYWEELGLGEIAEVLEIPVGTVKSRLHRARRLLREAMSQVPSTPEELRSASEVLSAWAAGVRGRVA